MMRTSTSPGLSLRLRRALLLAAWALPAHVAAQTAPPVDAPALDPLALQIQPAEADARIGLRMEAWAQGVDLRDGASNGDDMLGRAVLDFRREWRINEALRFGFSDRMEAVEGNADAADRQRNALRELYLNWQATPSWYVDAGRINLRQGVALGYNPTDWLRENAVVMRSSQNPAALRENRLGAVMLRAQAVDTRGSAQLALIPQLSDEDTSGSRFDDQFWSLGLERTNRHRAALFRVSPRTGERVVADFTAFTRAGDAPQLGSNLSYTASDSLILQMEWSGGRRAALPAAGETNSATDWFNRIAIGGAWTSPVGLVLTLEHHYAGDALSETEWNAWRGVQGSGARALGEMRRGVTERQDLLVRHYWFGRAAWDRAFGVEQLDLSAFVRRNAWDHSSMMQLEGTWHVSDRLDVSAMVNRMIGNDSSEFGSSPVRSALAVYLRWFM
ncbi:MAG: hypothetical protein REI94_02690 [Moraxellaceae bacterium]|nr:hypothetical protein [Moraxellaceae bacterium]